MSKGIGKSTPAGWLYNSSWYGHHRDIVVQLLPHRVDGLGARPLRVSFRRPKRSAELKPRVGDLPGRELAPEVPFDDPLVGFRAIGERGGPPAPDCSKAEASRRA